MITFPQIITEVQEATGRKGSDELLLIKRNVLTATKRFKSVIRRPWSRLSKKTDIVADQQDYQLPMVAQRVIGVGYLYGESYFPLIEVGSEEQWERLNAVPSVTIGIPRFFFPKGKNVISIYPRPGTAVSEGLRVYFEVRQGDIFAEDYTTGTVTVTNGSTTLTHSAAGFTPNMVGRYFHTTDGSDESWYQIVGYTNSSTLTLENYYEGISGSGVTFLIGYVPDIPEEYHDQIIDYAVGRFYLRRDPKKALEFMALFNTAIDECKELYSSPTSNDRIPNLGNTTLNVFDLPPGTLS